MMTDRDRLPYALEVHRPGQRARRLAGFVWGVLP